MSVCPHCGKPTISGFAFCPFCGKSVHPTEQATQPEEELIEVQPDEEIILEEVSEPETTPTNQSFKDKVVTASKDEHKRSIFKRALIVAFCALMFILAFCPVYTIPQYRFAYEEVSIFPTDVMSLLPAFSRNYDEEEAEEKLADLYEKLDEENESLFENGGVIRKSVYNALKKQEKEIYFLELEYRYSLEGDFAGKSTFSFPAAMLLINVLFSSVMLVLSVISLIFAILKKEFKFSCAILFPMYLFLALAIFYSSSALIGTFEIAGGLIATIFFACLALVVMLVSNAVQLKKDGKLKLIIPKAIAVSLSIIIAGCCFAPSISAEFNVEYDDSNYTFYFPVNNSAPIQIIFDAADVEELDEMVGNDSVYDVYAEHTIEYLHHLVGDYYEYVNPGHYGGYLEGDSDAFHFEHPKEYVNYYSPYYGYYYETVIGQAVIAEIGYTNSGALALGYFVVPIALLFLGMFVCLAMLDKKSKLSHVALAFVALFICASLICSAVTCSLANSVFEKENVDAIFSAQIGGGTISALILAIILIVFTAINKGTLWLKPTHSKKHPA